MKFLPGTAPALTTLMSDEAFKRQDLQKIFKQMQGWVDPPNREMSLAIPRSQDWRLADGQRSVSQLLIKLP